MESLLARENIGMSVVNVDKEICRMICPFPKSKVFFFINLLFDLCMEPTNHVDNNKAMDLPGGDDNRVLGVRFHDG